LVGDRAERDGIGERRGGGGGWGKQRAERVSCGLAKGFVKEGVVFFYSYHISVYRYGVLMHKKVPSHNSRK
jgi:hypothetical protein